MAKEVFLGGEGIPAFVPTTRVFPRTKFRRAAAARSRDGDVDVSAPKHAKSAEDFSLARGNDGRNHG